MALMLNFAPNFSGKYINCADKFRPDRQSAYVDHESTF